MPRKQLLVLIGITVALVCIIIYSTPSAETCASPGGQTFYSGSVPVLTGNNMNNTFVKISEEENINSHNEASIETNSNTDKIWMERRSALLRSTPVRKVILFAYMRGGSTFSGELFQRNPDATYWYEVGASLYGDLYGFRPAVLPLDITHFKNMSRRPYPRWEKEAISDYLYKLLSCNLTSMPPSFFAHQFTRISTTTSAFHECMGRGKKGFSGCDIHNCGKDSEDAIKNKCPQRIFEHKCEISGKDPERCDIETAVDKFHSTAKCYEGLHPQIEKCLPPLAKRCDSSTLISMKVHRFSMDALDVLLSQHQDIHILYLTRDPRGTMNSRSHIWSHAEKHMVLETKGLCSGMLADIKAARDLNSKYLGAIHILRYEDLARDPVVHAQEVYSFLGLDLPPEVRSYMEEAVNANQDSNRWGTTRANATATAEAWRHQLNRQNLEQMNAICSDVLAELGYAL